MTTETKNRKRVLVTGASGFIGMALMRKLLSSKDFLVTAVVRNEDKAFGIRALGVNTIVADLCHGNRLKKPLEGQDIVINLAYDFKRSERRNLKCFNTLLDVSIEREVKHFIHVSSIVVYDDWPGGDLSETSSSGKPGSEYKNAKVKMEMRLQQEAVTSCINTTILQPTIVYGPYSSFWTDAIVEKFRSGIVVIPDDGKGICNAVYVDDVSDALILAARTPGIPGDKFIISGPDPVTWKQYFESFNEVVGGKPVRYHDLEPEEKVSGVFGIVKHALTNPHRLANTRLVRRCLNVVEDLLGNRAIESLRSAADALATVQGPRIYYPDAAECELYLGRGVCSIDKAKEVLGYSPRFDFESGFKSTAGYIAANCKGAR